MTRTITPRRGASDIPSIAGRRSQMITPHQLYLRLASLALEHVRWSRERDSALSRLQAAETRFRAIATERAAILQKIAEAGVPGPTQPDSDQPRRDAGLSLEY